MKNILRPVIGVLVLLAAFSSWAQQEKAIALRGAVSCGVWLEERRKKTDTPLIFEAWVVGFMSGLAAGTSKNFLQGTDNEAIFFWLDKYCRENPLAGLGVAGQVLAFELIVAKRLLPP